MDWTTIGAQVAHWCAIIGGSISIPAVIGYIATSHNRIKLQNFIAKTSIENSAQIEAASEKAVEKAIGKLKTVTFKHDIEPVVAKKVDESIKRLEDKIDRQEEQNKHIVELFETFSAFFDDSYYIDDEKKAKCREAIEVAKADYSKEELAETVLEEEPQAESVNTENSSQNESHNTTSIER